MVMVRFLRLFFYTYCFFLFSFFLFSPHPYKVARRESNTLYLSDACSVLDTKLLVLFYKPVVLCCT